VIENILVVLHNIVYNEHSRNTRKRAEITHFRSYDVTFCDVTSCHIR